MDLPVWQRLYDELKDSGFMIIAVAMDSRGESAVRGPIRKAKTTYVSLIDRDHVVAELYNMTNVRRPSGSTRTARSYGRPRFRGRP